MNSYWHLPIALQGEINDISLKSLYKSNSGNSKEIYSIFDIQAEKCAICHPKIYNQWKLSRHALASSPGLLGQLPAFDEKLSNDCLNCHAPRIEQQLDWKKGKTNLHGIDCSACHLRKHLHYGPQNDVSKNYAPQNHRSQNKLQVPHGKVTKLKLFKQSQFCASCHQFTSDAILVNGKPLENTFEEWKASRYAKKGIQCQHCHMYKNHSFKGIHDKSKTREGLAIKITRDHRQIQLQATNIGAGHALPTYITPRIRIRISSKENNNKAEYLIQRYMTWDEKTGWKELYDTRLLPEQSVTLKLVLPLTEAASIEVIVEPDADYFERVYPLLIEQLAEQIDNKAMEQLKSAENCSKQTIYVLYSYDCPANTKTCVENSL